MYGHRNETLGYEVWITLLDYNNKLLEQLQVVLPVGHHFYEQRLRSHHEPLGEIFVLEARLGRLFGDYDLDVFGQNA